MGYLDNCGEKKMVKYQELINSHFSTKNMCYFLTLLHIRENDLINSLVESMEVCEEGCYFLKFLTVEIEGKLIRFIYSIVDYILLEDYGL